MAIQMKISEARDELADITSRVAYGHERVVLTSHGRARAALVSPRDLAILEALEDRVDLEDAYAALRADERAHGERVSWSELKGELGL